MKPKIKRTEQREERRIKSEKGEKGKIITQNKAMGGFLKLKEDGIRNINTVILKRSAIARS